MSQRWGRTEAFLDTRPLNSADNSAPSTSQSPLMVGPVPSNYDSI